MNILITGGTGYLGGRLVQWFTENTEHNIVIASRKKEPVLFSPDTPVVEIDWSLQHQIEAVCHNIDVIIHLAAMDAAQSALYPDEALKVSGVHTVRIIEAAISQKVARFIYLSTSHVYGRQSGVVSEDTVPFPTHPYATSHKAGEDVVLAANALRRIQGIVLRLSNSFGTPADAEANCWQLLVPQLCRQVVNEQRLTLTSAGLQKRNFIPIIDACRAISHFVTLGQVHLGNHIFNVGSRENLSVWAMAQKISLQYQKITGKQVSVFRPQPAETDKEDDYSYSIDLLQKSGFLFEGDIDTSIDELLKFCQENFHGKG